MAAADRRVESGRQLGQRHRRLALIERLEQAQCAPRRFDIFLHIHEIDFVWVKTRRQAQRALIDRLRSVFPRFDANPNLPIV